MKKPPQIAHVGSLARALRVPERDLRRLASRAARYYRPFSKLLRGKERLIDRPVDPLKRVQSRIYYSLLKPIKLPRFVQGGVPGRSHLTNASRHLGSKTLAKTDISACFPSISNRRVFRVWLDVCGHSPEVAAILTQLTTYRGHLPQGAPSSVALANLVLEKIDRCICSCCLEGAVYSRYVDDLSLSGTDVGTALGSAIRVLTSEGFRVVRDKTVLLGPAVRQEVTGQTINSGRLSAPRWRDSSVRSAIHRLKKLRIGTSEFAKELQRIHGKIGHIRLTNEARAQYLARCLAKSLSPPR